MHYVAALRHILAAAGDKIASVKASTSLLQPQLHPLDTVNAILSTASGRSGSFNVSFGSAVRGGFRLAVATTAGEVEMNPSEVKVTRLSSDGAKTEEVISLVKNAGVKLELQAWADSLAGGKVDARQSPEEALRDLDVLEGLLKAGETHSLVAVNA